MKVNWKVITYKIYAMRIMRTKDYSIRKLNNNYVVCVW
jgi:hypothetical protein